MNNGELFYTMALTRLTNFNYQQALELYKMVGSAQLLYDNCCMNIGPRLATSFMMPRHI